MPEENQAGNLKGQGVIRERRKIKRRIQWKRVRELHTKVV